LPVLLAAVPRRAAGYPAISYPAYCFCTDFRPAIIWETQIRMNSKGVDCVKG
jgi:hypothetical protein